MSYYHPSYPHVHHVHHGHYHVQPHHHHIVGAIPPVSHVAVVPQEPAPQMYYYGAPQEVAPVAYVAPQPAVAYAPAVVDAQTGQAPVLPPVRRGSGFYAVPRRDSYYQYY